MQNARYILYVKSAETKSTWLCQQYISDRFDHVQQCLIMVLFWSPETISVANLNLPIPTDLTLVRVDIHKWRQIDHAFTWRKIISQQFAKKSAAIIIEILIPTGAAQT